jgi:hypothetical protein
MEAVSGQLSRSLLVCYLLVLAGSVVGAQDTPAAKKEQLPTASQKKKQRLLHWNH